MPIEAQTPILQQDTTGRISERSTILMYCGSGYAFSEYFHPVIEELCRDYDIQYLQGDYALTESTRKGLSEFARQVSSFTFEVIPVFEHHDFMYTYHRNMSAFIRVLMDRHFDMLVLNTDFSIEDQYLIYLARQKNIPIMIMHTNIVSPEILRLSKPNKRINDLRQEVLHSQQESYSRKKAIIMKASNQLKRFKVRIKKLWFLIGNYYFFPTVFLRKSFKVFPYDRWGFTSGRADAVICYDPYEVEALKQAIPTLKNVYLAQHPAGKYSKDIDNEDWQDHSRKLLVLFSGYSVELPEEQILFWRESIRQVVELVKIEEVHLRFHPRTDKKLRWPSVILDFIRNNKYKYQVLDANEISLVEILPKYFGVLSGLSGALRTARVISNGFVIGLVNASGYWDEEDWMLGQGQGIHWLHPGEKVTPRHILPQQKSKEKHLPKVSEILRQELSRAKT